MNGLNSNKRVSVAEPTRSDRPVESSRRRRLSHLYFRYVAFYCRLFLAPLQTHPALFFPQFPESPQTWHRSNRSLSTYARVAYQLPVLRQPGRFCVRGVFTAPSYSHGASLSIETSLFLPSLSSTASEREAAPCGSAVFCFAIAPEQVLVPPAWRAPSKKADLGTWELPPARALRVVCLERLRASKGEVPCLYMLSGIGFELIRSPTVESLEHDLNLAGHSRNEGLRRQRRRA